VTRAARAVEAAAAALLGHPRHAALFALVGGLLLARAPLWAAGVLAAGCAVLVLGAGRALVRVADGGLAPAMLAGLVPGAGVAIACAVAALAGGAIGKERLRVVDSGRLAAAAGSSFAGPVVLLEPLRRRGSGPAVARVRLAGGPLRGEGAVLRVRGEVSGEPKAGGEPGKAPEGGDPGKAPDGGEPGEAPEGGEPGVGEILEVEGSVAPLGFFDAYQRPRGAGAAIDARAARRTGRRRSGVAGALDAVRRRAERGLDHGLREEDAALLRGMVLGQDERLSDHVRDEFQVSGLAHLLAVSGQNVMLLAILVLFAAGLAGVPLRARLALALLLVAAYVPLAGGGPSIQRAGVMGAAGLVAALAGRPASRWYALGLAAAGTLTLNPLAAMEPGWQLSFAAVVALMAMAPALRELLARRLPGPVADAAAITIAATVGTAPLMALHFESFSLVSLPANLAAAPAVAPIMWLGMLSAAAAQVSPALAAPLNALDGPLLAYLTSVARVAAGLPHAALPVRLASPVSLAVAFALPLALAAAVRAAERRLPPAGLALGGLLTRGGRPLGRGGGPLSRGAGPPGRARPLPVAAAVGCVALVAVLAWRHAHPPFRAEPGEVVVSFLDVGQGDATLIQDGEGTSVLFDGGPPEAAVHRLLRAAGVRRLDLVVATHQSRDHQGGLHGVLARIPVRLLLENGDGTADPDFRRLLAEADARGVRHVVARAGQVLRAGSLTVRLLAPAPRPPGAPPAEDPNPRGVAAIVSSGSFDLWLSADAESGAILPLPLRPVEAMKVSHHGSADPGLPHVLERLRPQVAAIEVGAGNDYGHPTRSTLDALRAVPRVYRTDRDGTVVLRVADGRMTVETGA
jgi:competence protein ComEC